MGRAAQAFSATMSLSPCSDNHRQVQQENITRCDEIYAWDIYPLYSRNEGEDQLATYSIQGLITSEGTSIGGDFRSGDIILFCGGTLPQRYHLLQTLMGNEPLPQGVVRYNEKDLNDLDPKRRAQLQNTDFAFLAGNDLLLDYLTIVENCLVSEQQINGITIERTKILLRRLGFQHPEAIYPEKLPLPKRKLVALARCLRKEPKVIFAYELFSGLLADEAKELWDDIVIALADRDVMLMATSAEPIETLAERAIIFPL